MSEAYSGIPEFQAEQAAIARRQKIAESLMAQSLQATPQTTAGGYTVRQSALDPIAKIFQAFVGRTKADNADADTKALAGKYNAGVSEALQKYQQAQTGTPESFNTNPDTGDVTGVPAQPGDKRKAITEALASQYPQIRNIAALDYAHMKKGDEPYTLGEGQTRMGPDNKPIATGSTKRVPPIVEHNFPVADNKVQPHVSIDGGVTWTPAPGSVPIPKFAKEVAPIINNVQPAPVTAVTIQDPDNPNATIIVDGRTNKVIGKGPKLTETGRTTMKQQTSMQGLGSALQQAEDLLMGQQRDSEGNVTPGTKPTGSLLGKGVDLAGSVVGYSPPGAREAQSLKVVGGVLTSKVPRFEGPQSDKDVAQYKQMAGNAADESLPRDQRLAAVRKMRELYAGYEDGSRGRLIQDAINNPGGAPKAPTAPKTPTATGAVPTSVDPKVWAAMTPEERKLFQ